MKRFFINIKLLSLIITAINLTSCGDVSKSCCEDILNFSYTENDSLVNSGIEIAEKCSQKYHKRPEFFQKTSQIYYYDAINDYITEEQPAASSQQSARKLYNALDYINSYFNKIDEIKSYDYLYRGEIYERLGDIYKDINSLKAASELYDKALSDYELSNNNEKYLNTLIKTGKLYQYNHIHNIAMIYFEMAEETDEIPGNIYRKIIDNKIVTLYELNDYKNADSIFRNHFNIKIQDYDFHSAIGTKYFYERDYESALPHLKYCFENGNQQEKLVLSEKLAEAYFNLNDHENEMIYIQHQAKNNSIEIRRTPLKLDLDKLFDTHHNIVNNQSRDEKDKDLHLGLILSLVLSLLIISSIATLFLIKVKKQQQKKNGKIGKKNTEKSHKSKTINTKPAKPSSSMNDESFDEAYQRFCKSDIYTKIKASLEGMTIMTKNVHNYSKLALSNNDLIQISRTFSNCFPNAIQSLKNEFKEITPGDIKFIILDFMNLNNVEIAVLLGLTYGAANKKCNKIKNIFNTKDELNTYIYDYIKSKF